MTQAQTKRPRGRPVAPERPKPLSWRPKTEQIRDQFFENGGSRWLNRLLEEQVDGKNDTND
jgi:hypothetical protein